MNTNNTTSKTREILTMMFLFIVAISMTNKSHAVVTVGPVDDDNCDFYSLYSAISAVPSLGSETIRLVGNNNGFEADGNLFMFDKNVAIYGGYDSCSDSTSDDSNPSVISTSTSGISNINILGLSSVFETRLTLSLVHVKDGNNDKGGGVKITGNAHLNLLSSEIYGNQASLEGGGIYISGGKLTINYSSKITDNESDSLGGGVYCTEGEINFISGEVSYNYADKGAGMNLDNCLLNGTSGNEAKSISHNRGRNGVGILASNGAIINMGNNNSISLFEGNLKNDGYGWGGAMYLENESTTAKLINSHFIDNTNTHGGAVYVNDNASFTLASSYNCQLNSNYVGCASFQNNHARGDTTSNVAGCEVVGGVGGAIFSENADILLDGVSINHNKSSRTGCIGVDYVRGREPRGSAIYAKSSNIKVIDSVINRNGGDHAKSIFYMKNSRLDLIQSTVANNRTDVDATIRALGGAPNIQLWGSIIAEGGTDIYNHESGENSVLMGGCNMVSDLSELNNGGSGTENLLTTIEGNPDFVDSGNNNYNLNANSPAIDFCDFTSMEATGFSHYFAKDYNGKNRAYVLTDVIYPMDLGAMEYSNGTPTGQSDLKITVTGDTTSSQNGNIRYVFNADNLGSSTSDQTELVIQLDENTGAFWIDINPENPQDWNCSQSAHTINCSVLGDLTVNRVLSPLVIDVSADVIDITTVMSANISDYRSLDPNTSNNDGTVTTVITGISDVIFKNGFDD